MQYFYIYKGSIYVKIVTAIVYWNILHCPFLKNILFEVELLIYKKNVSSFNRRKTTDLSKNP